MAIISRNKPRKLRYGSNQLRYAVVYIALTVIVMLFLNFYCSWTSQQLFYRSKHTAMMDKILLVSSAVGEQEVLNADTAAAAIICYGNDGGDIFRVEFQAAQNIGKAVSAADGNDFRPVFAGSVRS